MLSIREVKDMLRQAGFTSKQIESLVEDELVEDIIKDWLKDGDF